MTGRWAWRGATVGLVVATGVLLLLGPYRLLVGSATGSTPVDRVDPCLPGTAVPILDSPHIAHADAASVRYNSEPPTSGPHAAFTAPPGVYLEPVQDLLAVHALEHGHIVVQYGSEVPADAIGRLTHLVKVFAGDTLLAPRPALGPEIALTAWGRLDRLAEFDESRIVAFVEHLRGRYDHGWTSASRCTG